MTITDNSACPVQHVSIDSTHDLLVCLGVDSVFLLRTVDPICSQIEIATTQKCFDTVLPSHQREKILYLVEGVLLLEPVVLVLFSTLSN